MWSILIVSLSVLTNVLFFFLMYEEIFVPTDIIFIIMSIILAGLYIFVGYIFGEYRSKRLSRFFFGSLTLNIGYMLSSLVYYNWKMVSVISELGMMRFSLIILTLGIGYLHFVYIRAEINYKRKIGNQRIQKEPKKNKFDLWREQRKASKGDEITIVLGNSTESADQISEELF